VLAAEVEAPDDAEAEVELVTCKGHKRCLTSPSCVGALHLILRELGVAYWMIDAGVKVVSV